MPYAVNGTTKAIGPHTQTWENILTGQDHNGRPVYAAQKTVRCEFDVCTHSQFQEWATLDGASLTSVQILNLDGTSFNTYAPSALFYEVDRPGFVTGHVGPWSLRIHGIAP